MGEKMWYESVTTPWLKLNYLSCATRPSLSDSGRKNSVLGSPGGVYSPILHHALLDEEGKRTPSSTCSSPFPSANERRNDCHVEERGMLFQGGFPRTTPSKVKDTWRSAARIQPIESTKVDGIASFMTSCARHLEEEKEKELSHEAELLQRKLSVPLCVTHARTTNAALTDGISASVTRHKNKAAEVRDCPVEEASGSAEAGELAEEDKVQNHVYTDDNLSRLLRDFNTAHKFDESLAGGIMNVPSEKMQQLKVLALNDHTELSTPLLSTIVSSGSRSLRVLELAGCKLDGTLTRAMGECTQLEALDLSYCKNLKSLNFLQNLTDLRVLRLSGCKEAVTDTVLAEWLTCASRLEIFHIGNCPRLTNEGLHELGCRLRCLTEFNISDFEALGDHGLASVCFASPSLEHINFSRCGSALTDEGAAVALAPLRKLKHIDSSGNVQIGHQMLVKLKPKALEYLSVTRSQSIKDETLFTLVKNQGSSRLRIIDLRACTSLTPDGIKAFIRGCPSLKAVDLDSVPTLDKDDFSDLKHIFPRVHTNGSYSIPEGKMGLPTFRVLPTVTNKGRR